MLIRSTYLKFIFFLIESAANEVKNYLKFIRGIGIKAWIPGSPESYPEMSVADQCRSGVLCLNYKGSDIYIQGNSRRATNDKILTGFFKNLDHDNSINGKSLDRFDSDYGKTTVNENLGVNIISPSVKIIFKRDVSVQCNGNDITDDLNEIPKFSKTHNRFKKSVETAEVDGIQNKIFVSEITGVEFKRTVKEKLTREVRVAKCYVSSLPNCVPNHGNCNKAIAKNAFCHLDKKAMRLDYTGKLWSSLDCKRSPEIKKSGLSPGFVRQLIKQFDVYDNVEQQCPRHEAL